MIHSSERGVLTIAIDLQFDAARTPAVDKRAGQQVVAHLLDCLTESRLPATWAVAEPGASVVLERIIAAQGQHEVALLGDADWVGRAAGRTRFGRELIRRSMTARAAGVQIATLVLKGTELSDASDLAVRQGIVAVGDMTPEAAFNKTQGSARAGRFGLWSFPASQILPAGSRWLPGGGGWRAARGLIDRAAAQRGIAHLAIDVAGLARRGSSALTVVERVVRHAALRQQQDALDVLTFERLAARLASPRQVQGARSILRPAA